MSPERMPVAEFRALGFIQEINRRLLHPLGLALEVTIEEDGSERISGVWDCRDDPEGIYFGDDPDETWSARAAAIDASLEERAPARRAALGYVIQPLP